MIPPPPPQRASRLKVVPAELLESLDARSRPGALWEAGPNGTVRCHACAHRCVIAAGSRGACGTRYNRAGELFVPHGYVARRYVRAVETNTIFHVLPGAQALTFGMYGCDLRCPYCHNHRVSQALRDGPTAERPLPRSAEEIVEEALSAGCSTLCAAYNEPMISAEWTRSVFEAGKRRGLVTAVISDGHSTREALTYLRDVCDVFRVDWKAADDEGYRALGGRLAPVLDSIATARELGYWVEVVTLVVPGLNQALPTIRQMAGTLAAMDRDIPWHLNAFVPRYRWSDRPHADPGFLTLAAGTAYAAGLRFVYVGNLPGDNELAHTRCARCHAVLIRRHDYQTVENRVVDARCPDCRVAVPGIWTGPRATESD